MRTTTLLLTCALTMTAAAGCLNKPEETTTTSVNWFSLTPIHCENGHKPVHCGVGNVSAITPAGNFSASFLVDGAPIPNPLIFEGDTTITARLSYQGPPGSADLDITIAIDDVGGVKMISPKNVTKTLAVGTTQDVLFQMEPTQGWPAGDWVCPRVVLGVDDDEWVEGHLIFVIAEAQ